MIGDSQKDRPSTVQRAIGLVLIALGFVVFAIRLQHEGAYAVPRGGNLFGGLGALVLGGLLVWPGVPRPLVGAALALSPIILFFALYATMSELEEVISLYAYDSEGRPAELRLWVIDREDGEWVGMPKTKAVEHALDGAQLEVLRAGETRCVVPVLFEDRPTVADIHARKIEKYGVAQVASSIGLYPAEARPTSVALRLDPCPGN